MIILVGEGALTVSTGDESYQEASLGVAPVLLPTPFVSFLHRALL